ncbi:MAG: FAD/NAD(P)-binding protein [Ignavibacteria bacterium]
MNKIIIIGAGLSGRLLSLNLLRTPDASNGAEIILIDKGNEKYMGPAYSADEKHLLLNVPADRMGAYSDDPEHFLKWVRNKGINADKFDFLPRSLYREYILELLHEAIRSNKNNLTFKHISREVIDIEYSDNRIKIYLQTGETILADKVVLALGNFPPADPKINNPEVLKSKRYIRNPWTPGILSSLSENDSVFLIGTGQTMVDLVLILQKRNHKGKITGISRHGYLPLVHKGFDAYDSYYEELKEKSNVYDIFKVILKHMERAGRMGTDIRGVIDSLRPATQSIWKGLPEQEKYRFNRHLYRYWEIIRSRIPAESDAVIKKLISSGQLRIIPGRVVDLKERIKNLEIHYLIRGETPAHIEPADFIINCCGPESDYSRIDDILVRNLMKKEVIHPGPVNLGIDALADGSVIGKDGVASGKLFTIGPPMRGVLFETIAVPEIRVQAEQLAEKLLEN